MDSLPDQRIEALPGATRKAAYEKIGLICLGRSKGVYSEHQIAKKAGFGGAEAMHHQLKTWGLTSLLPLEKQSEAPKSKAADPDPGQKPRSSSQPEEVPDTSTAAELFNEALDGLARAIEDLEDLSQVYQGKRFAATYTFESIFLVRRSDYSEETWQYLSEQYGRDPNAESFYVYSSEHPLGAGPYPPRDLVALIAAYALSGRPMEPLVEVLYPGYSQEDFDEVKELLSETKPQKDRRDGLLRTAQQFAAAVYGRKLGKGAPPREVVVADHWLACHITERREAGTPD